MYPSKDTPVTRGCLSLFPLILFFAEPFHGPKVHQIVFRAFEVHFAELVQCAKFYTAWQKSGAVHQFLHGYLENWCNGDNIACLNDKQGALSGGGRHHIPAPEAATLGPQGLQADQAHIHAPLGLGRGIARQGEEAVSFVGLAARA